MPKGDFRSIKLRHIKNITELYGPSLYPKQLVCIYLLVDFYGKKWVEKYFGLSLGRLVNIFACVPFSIPTALQIHALLDGEVPLNQITPRWDKFVKAFERYVAILKNTESPPP